LKETGELTDEQKKMLDEFENKREKVLTNNELFDKYIKEGREAFKNKNYDAAITSFESGYNVDPGFMGSAPVFLNLKADALRERAVMAYDAAVQSKKRAELDQAKQGVSKDFAEALIALNKSYQMTKNANPSQIINKENHKNNIETSEKLARQLIQIMSKINVTLASYIVDEKDAENAVKIYKDTLVMLPNDPDVLGSLGLTLYFYGESTGSKEQKQQCLNYMNAYKKVAPKDHFQQEAVAELIDILINIDKLKPQDIR